MKIELMESAAIARRWKLLIQKHDSISIAVAWGDLTDVADALIANKAKFGSVLFGVDFSATDPDLIDKLIDVPNAFVAKNRVGSFHPKILPSAAVRNSTWQNRMCRLTEPLGSPPGSRRMVRSRFRSGIAANP